MSSDLELAYAQCIAVAQSHYENFPVASWLVPKHLRIHVATIYNFARRADDFADEGDDPPEQKIAALEHMADDLNACLDGQYSDYLFHALSNTIQQYRLDPQLFLDLLSAFTQDISKTRYENFDEVLDYCRRSANPVGRLMLQLFNEASEQNNVDSDRICTALQLINFYQDIQQDLVENDRVYFPLDEMNKASVSIEELRQKNTSAHVTGFIQEQILRAKNMMLEGAPLGQRLRGRFGLEIRAIISGGLHICNALQMQGDNVYSRPRLTFIDKLGMIKDSFFGNNHPR